MHTHRLCSALVTLMALILIIAGPAAPAATVLAAPPPPPNHDHYLNWNSPEEHLPIVPQAAPNSADPTPEQITAESFQFQCNPDVPSALNFTGLVTDGLDLSSNNIDIYYRETGCEGTGYGFTRLTTHPADDFMPRLSKDSQKVVFVSNRDGNTEIYSMRTSGGAQTRLTSYSGGDSMPAFSPDGKKIVFTSDRGNGSADIYVMNADGTGVKRLTTGSVNELEPDWSPDGKQIAFVRRTSDNRSGALYLMNADGSHQRPITPYLAWLSRPVWSQSGQKLAIMYDPDGDDWYDLGVVGADGSSLTWLTINKKPNEDLLLGAWLPKDMGLIYDARTLLYIAGNWYLDKSYLYLYDLQSSFKRPTLDYYDMIYAFNPDASSLDDTPPQSALKPLPEWTWGALDIPIPFTASDNYAGLGHLVLDYRTEGMTEWAEVGFKNQFGARSLADSFIIDGSKFRGKTVYFRMHALDMAENLETKNGAAETWTRMYAGGYHFLVTDTRDHPLPGQVITLSRTTMNGAVISGPDGIANAYMPSYDSTTAEYTRTGYGSLPVQNLPGNWELSMHTVLPGTDDVLVNGYFNDAQDPRAGWQTGGVVPVSTTTSKLYRSHGVALGPCPYGVNNCVNGEGTLSQVISLPQNMHNPTLSFYQQATYTSSGDATFQVLFTPQNGQPVVLLSKPVQNTQAALQHTWVDMSPYRGQTGTLTFRLHEGSNSNTQSIITLEEITLSSWTTPILSSASPLTIPVDSAGGTWIDLEGENFTPTAQVFLGDLEITALERTGSTHIRFQLPEGIPAGSYDLHVVNPGGEEARPKRPLWVGYFLSLPSISR